MSDERSFGVIPLRQHHGDWEVFLVQLHAGHWGFPKGHAHQGEDPQGAAERELWEETHLTVETYISADPLKETYTYSRSGKQTRKEVVYYLALVSGDFELQQQEVQAGDWFKLSDAANRITFPACQQLCQNVVDIIT